MLVSPMLLAPIAPIEQARPNQSGIPSHQGEAMAREVNSLVEAQLVELTNQIEYLQVYLVETREKEKST